MAIVQKPFNQSEIFAKSGPPAWKQLPTWYQVSSNDRWFSPDTERMFAKRMNATTISLPSSHGRIYHTRMRLPNSSYANRYDIRSDSFFHISSSNNFSPSEMFQKFIQQVNSQIPYNNNGKINAIQLASNMIGYNSGPYPITVQLFYQEIRYLHDSQLIRIHL